jgi:hypothetical protein
MNEIKKKTIKESATKEKYTSCCQILSIFASHANLNIDETEEESYFNDFACRFFQVLEKHDQLCPKCLDFYKRLKKEFGEKSVRVKRNPEKYEKAKLKEKLIIEELKKRKH